MKNVQVIDGADNCTYDIFGISDEGFALMFPNGQDIEFISDFIERVGKNTAGAVTAPMWNRRRDKKKARGIHGTLFYQLDFKKEYYPTKKEDEMVTGFEVC